MTIRIKSASNFAVLAGSTITNTGESNILTNVGVSPGTGISGFPPGVVSGSSDSNNSSARAARSAVFEAYQKAQELDGATALSNSIPNETVLTPGVYHSSGSVDISGHLILQGSGQYVFQIKSSLITGSGSIITLTNGADADDIFWQVGHSAILGPNSHFYGTILAQNSITVNNNATINGHLFAKHGSVHLENVKIYHSV